MAYRIYTGKGDQGYTALIGGTKVSKGSLRIAAYGSVDTLNAYIGMVADEIGTDRDIRFLRRIQQDLFVIGAMLATDPKKKTKMKLPLLEEKRITELEKEIDAIDRQVPPLRHFILPGGHRAVSVSHLARCHCRETERCCVALDDIEGKVPELIVPYLNRLGDYLFMLSRKTAKSLQIDEILWKP